LIASCVTASIVGDIMKKVKNIARPIITGLGGICWPPRACRRKESTTTILVKEVNMMSIAGRRDKKLIMRKTSTRWLSMFIFR
jgi:hypothetical protein